MKSIIRSAGIIFILSIVLGLVIPCQASDIKSDINIVGTVTPTTGKENTNFTYSATITFPKGNLDINSALNIELTISDNKVNKSVSQSGKFYGNGFSPEELIRGRSDPYTFSFNPGREGLKNIDELSYEFVLTTSSGKELARNKYPGPKIVIPPEFQSIQYSKTPVYYFQEYPITLTFNDKPSVIPSLRLSFRGPLNSSEEMTWTEDLSSTSAGITHTFSKSIDLTKFRKGGNFIFNFTYDDFRANEGYAPITKGPYYFTILPYSPKIVEPISLAKQIEYNNFSVSVLVEDEGKVLIGDPVGSSASLIIDHPTKGKMIFNNSVPTLQGKYLVFEWDKNSVLFEKSDVLQSKIKPLQAHLRYWNENRNYGANSSNYSFVLVNVTPMLTENHDSMLHMMGGETALQKVKAFVTYAKGMGDLKIVVIGPTGRYENTLKGSPAGVNKYEYDWNLPFNTSQAGNYNLSFTYIHDSLEGGFYEFDQKPEYSFQVVPIFIEFKNGNVSKSRGRWNSSYSYTVEVNSSVEANAILQIYSPCSSEWADAGGSQKIKAGKSNITWTIQPFTYDCDELSSGKYRFRANYLGNDFPSTRVYEGPQIINDEVKLLSLEYSSPVYVPIGSQSEQTIRAMVRSPLGSGKVRLGISGPDMNFNETKSGTVLGDDSYQYEWTVPFNDSHVDHNYTLSLGYQNSDLPGEYPLGDKTVQVKPLWFSFGGAKVEPGAGRWNDTYLYSVTLNRSVETELVLEVYDLCRHEWVTRARVKAPSGSGIINMTTTPLDEKCPDAEGKVAQYRLAASFMGQSIESDVYYGPSINGSSTSNNTASNGPKSLVPNVIGTVNPRRGVLQAWQESDALYTFTYSAQLKNLSSGDAPWVELLVKAPGSSWKSAGEKQQYDPAQGNISWTVKPFFDRDFLGTAEFKFLIDGGESKVFRGPEIVAVYNGLNYEKSTQGATFNYFGKVNASINLTIDLLSSDDNVQWKDIGKPQKYISGSGEVLRIWNNQPAIRYFEFDFRTDTGGVIN